MRIDCACFSKGTRHSSRRGRPTGSRRFTTRPSSGVARAAQLLVDHRADLEAPARNEQFAPHAHPLHSAAAAQQLELVALLLDAGADPNAHQHGGYTPLLEAAQRGDAKLAKLLLDAGADPSAKLEDGRSAEQLARDAGALDLARRLEER
jgi:uncharacterized protein